MFSGHMQSSIFSVLLTMAPPPSRLKTLAEELAQTQQMLLSKEEAVLELEKRIEESSETCEKKSE